MKDEPSLWDAALLASPSSMSSVAEWPNQGAGKRRGEIREAEPDRAAQSDGRRMPDLGESADKRLRLGCSPSGTTLFPESRIN